MTMSKHVPLRLHPKVEAMRIFNRILNGEDEIYTLLSLHENACELTSSSLPSPFCHSGPPHHSFPKLQRPTSYNNPAKSRSEHIPLVQSSVNSKRCILYSLTKFWARKRPRACDNGFATRVGSRRPLHTRQSFSMSWLPNTYNARPHKLTG